MPTNRAIISELSQDIRANDIDDRVSQRYILSKLQDFAALYIKRENDLFRLFNQQDIWTTIECLEMESVDTIKCCDIHIPKCNFMMRSIEKLPDIYTYRNGLIIREVMSIDSSKNFLPTSPINYKNITEREFIDKRLKYFWIENGHLVIPDSMVQYVRISAYFRDAYKAKLLGCNVDSKEVCISPLDQEFQCPSHLLSTVKNDCLQSLLQSFKRVPVDELPNDDINKKTGI